MELEISLARWKSASCEQGTTDLSPFLLRERGQLSAEPVSLRKGYVVEVYRTTYGHAVISVQDHFRR